VIETNPAGTSSAASDHTKFTVAVPAPTITNIVDAVGHQGTVPEGGMTNDNHPTISGTGTPGALIQIYQNGDGCGGVYVDSTGHWSLTITGPMSNGSHKMTAKQIVSGQTSADSNGWTITIDTSVPAMPEITSVVDNVGSMTGAIKLNGMTDDARPVVNGTGKAGDNIKLYDGSTLIGTATVGADGKWSIRPSNALSNALHDLTATDTNVAGTVSPASQHFTFTVNTATPATPDAPTVTDNGSWVPPGGTMPDGHPVISNTSTGTSGDVITIYGNGNRIGSTTIGSDGKWSFKPSTDLSSGLHNITVTDEPCRDFECHVQCKHRHRQPDSAGNRHHHAIDGRFFRESGCNPAERKHVGHHADREGHRHVAACSGRVTGGVSRWREGGYGDHERDVMVVQ
jgi:hypothetical protein